jgi:hypothetical protein
VKPLPQLKMLAASISALHQKYWRHQNDPIEP